MYESVVGAAADAAAAAGVVVVALVLLVLLVVVVVGGGSGGWVCRCMRGGEGRAGCCRLLLLLVPVLQCWGFRRGERPNSQTIDVSLSQPHSPSLPEWLHRVTRTQTLH